MTFLFSKTERYLLNLLKECKQSRSLKYLNKRYLALMLSVFLLAIIVSMSFSGMAVLSEIQAVNVSYIDDHFSNIPPEVIQDAKTLSNELFGQSSNSEIYFKQLISAYSAISDKNLLIIFNPGGWGTKALADSTDWTTIVNGMAAELGLAGYKVAILNYQRTKDNLVGHLNEIEESISGYYSKSKDLATRIEFLINENPELNVILTGESTGTMICDSTMNLLKNNDRVYSIQTGSPFWQNNTIRDRTIVVNDNGVIPDTFSRGDLFTAAKSNLKALIGNNSPKDEAKILNIFYAPGHEYWWQNPKVYSQIGAFLKEYFGVQSEFQDN
jgi:hypothetical protein